MEAWQSGRAEAYTPLCDGAAKTVNASKTIFGLIEKRPCRTAARLDFTSGHGNADIDRERRDRNDTAGKKVLAELFKVRLCARKDSR
jgi:hypothetical protein